jgi:hypothetical protein
MSFADIQKFKSVWVSKGFDSKFAGVLPFRRVRPFLTRLAGAEEKAAAILLKEKAAIVQHLQRLDAQYPEPRYLTAASASPVRKRGGGPGSAFAFTQNIGSALSNLRNLGTDLGHKATGIASKIKHSATRSRASMSVDTTAETVSPRRSNDSPLLNKGAETGIRAQSPPILTESTAGGASRSVKSDDGIGATADLSAAAVSALHSAQNSSMAQQISTEAISNPLSRARSEVLSGAASDLTTAPARRPRVATRAHIRSDGPSAPFGLASGKLAGLAIPGAAVLTPLQKFLQRGLARRWWWAIFRAELQSICFKHNGERHCTQINISALPQPCTFHPFLQFCLRSAAEFEGSRRPTGCWSANATNCTDSWPRGRQKVGPVVC